MENKGALEVSTTKTKIEILVTNKCTTWDQQFSTLQSENLANEVALSSPRDLFAWFWMLMQKGKARMDS